MKLSITGIARLVEKRSDERDNVKLTNAIRELMNGHGEYVVSGTTTDATPTNIWTDQAPYPPSIVDLFARVVMYDSTGPVSQSASYWKRAVLGYPSIGGATISSYTVSADNETGGAAACDAVFTGTATEGQLALQVTGIAGRTCNWRAWITVLAAPWE